MKSRKVLITGATGFIGGRICETFYLTGQYQPKAGLRSWSSAARIGRFPIEMVICDVMNEAQVAEALQDCYGLVHCAVGNDDVIIKGTRTILRAAQKANLQRILHISTVDVYGEPTGDIAETQPQNYSGKAYADSKIEAEKLCWESYEQGLPITILRPGIVYGPFSKLWTIRYAERLVAKQWGLLDGFGNGQCNLIYVDDLVSAVGVALEHPKAVGQAFHINQPQRVTWNDYFQAFNQALGFAPLNTLAQQDVKRTSNLLQPVRLVASHVMKKYQAQVMRVYAQFALAKKIMKQAEESLRLKPSKAELEIYKRSAYYLPQKAQEVIGYTAQHDMNSGLAKSVQWLKHHGYVPVADFG